MFADLLNAFSAIGTKRQMALPRYARVCQPAAQSGAFWRTRTKIISLHQQKEEGRRLFLFSRFKGHSVLYERKNYPI